MQPPQQSSDKFYNKVYHIGLVLFPQPKSLLRVTFHCFICRRKKYDEFITGNRVKDGKSEESIRAYFNPITKYKANDPKQKKLRDAVTKFIIEDSLPVSTVESSAFRKLLEIADSRYVPTNR